VAQLQSAIIIIARCCKMVTNSDDSDVDNMAIQTQQTRGCCESVDELATCSGEKRTGNWSPGAWWIWRMSNAAMVAFFLAAAYVQVRCRYIMSPFVAGCLLGSDIHSCSRHDTVRDACTECV